ncbi:hypothetical protein [Bremerella sp.]|uniref:DUF7691 family protein n=1 Tax=Bremerella sp. TaxID=2795602 RepID=UPI0039194EB8
MGYTHAFFAVDIDQLKGLFGSNNDKLLAEILNARADDIEELDESFEDEINDGELPSAETALRQIFSGTIQPSMDGDMHAQVLLVICEHLGEQVFGGEYGVAGVADHPYDSLLLQSGPPLPIPEPEDVPEIRYLTLEQIDDEIALASAKHDKVASDSAEAMSTLRKAFGLRRGGIDPEEMQEDIDAYIETLQKVKAIGKGVVSFYE